jgi:hypothetical protein
LFGKHALSFPDATMREIIIKNNLLSKLNNLGRNAVFINAYPMHAHFFDKNNVTIDEAGLVHFSPEFPHAFKRRLSVTSCMMLAANQRPFSENDLRNGHCLYQDFTNKLLIERGFDIPVFTPENAAKVLYNASCNHDFILYEFFQTDVCGHRGSFEEQTKLVTELNHLVKHLVSLLDRSKDTLIITSDHGNLEDSSNPLHTKNPVPLICWGNCCEMIRNPVNSLADVTPAIVRFFAG